MKIKFLIAVIFSLIVYNVKAQDTIQKASKLSELSLDELMSIKVVTASGFEQTTNEAPSTILVITSRQIEERGYEQLTDALRDIPGIDMIHINGYAPTFIYFRGMYGAENLRALLMIDGIPENNIVGSNDMAGPAYNLHNVERIEIISGPASALYGANAFGGVINIITKKGEDMNGFHAEKAFGTFNTSIDKVSFGINKSNFEIALAGSLYSTDGPKFSNRDPNYSASYVDKAYSLNGTVSYLYKKLKTTFGFRTYQTPTGWGTFLNSPTKFLGLPPQGNGNQGVIGLIARDVRGERSGLQDLFSRTVYIQGEFTASQKLNVTGRFVYRETGISEKSYAYITIDSTKIYRVPTAGYSNRVKAEIIANYSPAQNHQIAAGIQFFQDNVEKGSRKINLDNTVYLIDGRDTLLSLYSSFKPRDYDIRNNFGSYLQYSVNTKLFRKTSFTVGARYDHNSYFETPVSPRFAIVIQPTSKLTMKFLFGTAYRAPTNTEIYQAPSNVKIETEKIRTYEANFIYRSSKRFLFQLNWFRNELYDVILLGNLVNLNTEKNPGLFTINGVEAKADIVLSNYFSGFANFTWQDAIGKNTLTGAERQLSGIARVKGNMGITTNVKDLFKVSVIGNWVGKRQVPTSDPFGPVDGYFLTNCAINTAKFFNNRVTAGVTISNLFGANYLDPGIRTADGIIYPTVLEQQGRTILFKVGLSF